MFDKELDFASNTLLSKPATPVASLGQLAADPRIGIFAASVVLFHFANAAMLPLVGQKLTAGATHGTASTMSACIIVAQLVMIPVALASSRLADSWGRKPTLLLAFAVLPVRGALYTLSDNAHYLVAIQLLDGIGAGVINVVGVLVIADLTRGTGRFNLMQGGLATASGLGAALSNLLTGVVVQAAGFDAGFLALAAIAAAAFVYFACTMPETRLAGAGGHEFIRLDDRWRRRTSLFPEAGDECIMIESDRPVVVVVPGDLHLTEPDCENVRVANWVVNEINRLIRPDFVQFIGDNVQDATEHQFQLFDEVRKRLEVPHFALVGDHDVKGDPSRAGFRRHAGEPYGAMSLGGFRFIRLDTQEAHSVGLSSQQSDWFAGQVDEALAEGERVVVFQHNYPYQIWEDFAGPGVDESRAIVQTRRIHAIVCGHTHYWQVANDGRNVAIATRSIGDPEGGPPGYTLLYLDGDDLAVTYRSVEDRGPVVLVTHPRQRLLATGPRHIVSGPDRVEVRAWSESRVWAVRYRIDEGPWAGLESAGDRNWSGLLAGDRLDKGEHILEVVAVAADDSEGYQRVIFMVDSTGRYTAVPEVRPVVASTAFC